MKKTRSLLLGSTLLLILLLPTTSHAAQTFSRNLSLGMSGSDVSALQQLLKNNNDLASAITGYFGSLTQAALEKWQAANNLPPIGVLGPRSRAVANGSSTPATVSTSGTPSTTSTVTLTIGSFDAGGGVASVEYFINGVRQGSPVTTAPYSLRASLPQGTYLVSIRITYANGFVITPPARTVVITPNTDQLIGVIAGQSNGSPSHYSMNIPTTISISAILGTFADITKNYNDSSFTLTAPTSNSPGSFSFSSSDASVASVSGTTVTITGMGTASITATQSASGSYTSAAKTATMTVIGACEQVTNPCLNSGVCSDVAPLSFSCSCASGYSGTLCQNYSSACTVCLFGGSCVADQLGGHCACINGYTGNICQNAPLVPS